MNRYTLSKAKTYPNNPGSISAFPNLNLTQNTRNKKNQKLTIINLCIYRYLKTRVQSSAFPNMN